MAARLPTSLLLACGLLVWAVDIDKGEWSHARCLDAGFPPERRRGLPAGTLAGAGGGAQNLTLGMSDCCWMAQELSTIVARVILEEWLGFHVNYANTSDRLPAYLAVAGCQDSEDWACEELDADHPAVHVSLGAWHSRDIGEALLTLGSEQAQAAENILSLGSTGYHEIDTEYLMKEVAEQAQIQTNLDLQWGPNLAQAARFFTPLDKINTSLTLYQNCDVSPMDSWELDYKETLLERGYLCNASLTDRNPWRRSRAGDAQDELTWDPDGEYPIRPLPKYQCPTPPVGRRHRSSQVGRV